MEAWCFGPGILIIEVDIVPSSREGSEGTYYVSTQNYHTIVNILSFYLYDTIDVDVVG